MRFESLAFVGSHISLRNTESSPPRPCVRCAAIRITRLAFIRVTFVPRGSAEWPAVLAIGNLAHLSSRPLNTAIARQKEILSPLIAVITRYKELLTLIGTRFPCEVTTTGSTGKRLSLRILVTCDRLTPCKVHNTIEYPQTENPPKLLKNYKIPSIAPASQKGTSYREGQKLAAIASFLL